MSSDSRESPAGESVFARWSRRKLEAEQPQAEVREMPAREAGVGLEAPPAEQVIDEQKPLTDADMPDIDSLGEDSDFSGFMSPGVSDRLRNLALRKLFHAPVFNIRDGLDEYDDDYTKFEKLGDIVTCDMKHQIEMQEKKLREALAQENQAGADGEPQDMEAAGDEEALAEEADEPVKRQPQTASAAPGDNEIEAENGHE
jgi:hypothetical protein